MTHICHLLDETLDWEQRISLTGLMDRLDTDRFTQRVVATDPSVLTKLGEVGFSRAIEVMPQGSRLNVLSAPPIKQFVYKEKFDFIHAWSAKTAAFARTLSDRPIILELFDPVIAWRDIKLIRSIAMPNKFAVACSCEIVRRRLVEGGLPLEYTVVVRPGIDFGLINKIKQKKNSLREQLNIDPNHQVMLVPPPSPDCDSRDVLSAVSLMNFKDRNLRLIVPGLSRGQGQLKRLHEAWPVPHTLVCPGDQFSMEQLIAISDVLVVASRGDLSTSCIAWAMACKTAIVGTAVHAVAELIANKLNGLLFKQTPDKSMVNSIAKCLHDHQSLNKAAETAHGQAYEVFSMRRSTDQHAQLYNNVLSGAAPSENITDPAMTG